MAYKVKYVLKLLPQTLTRDAISEKFSCFSQYGIAPKQINNTFVNKSIESAGKGKTVIHFRPLERRKNNQVDQSQYSFSSLLNGLPRSFFGQSGGRQNKRKRVPRLVLLQNPFKWLMVKLDFTILRRIWDHEFTEKEFKYGTKQAISRVTQLISQGQYVNLNGLLTKPAKVSLIRELDRNYSDKQRSLLSLDNDDIQITAPRKVYFIKIADRKYCDVDMAFLALKWVPIHSIDALVLTEIFARFHREYTPNCIPEWTIAYFKITRFQILRRIPIEMN